ncbi:MAG: formylglycine-generating enzyme family protein [Thermodesulfobacteriota bacterium]
MGLAGPAFADPPTTNFVYIGPPTFAGIFVMGTTDPQAADDEKPNHQVTLSPFYLSDHEVTRGEWKEIMGTTPWLDESLNPRADVGGVGTPEDDQYPCTYISWDMAMAYCAAKNTREGGNWFRLPTEAEWECAAKAGSRVLNIKYSEGIDEANIGDYAWYRVNTTDLGEPWPRPVRGKLANVWGLYDMQGNVEEWVLDWYGAYSGVAATNPSGPTSGDAKVMRGGSYQSPAYNTVGSDLTSPNREAASRTAAPRSLGFRMLRVITPYAYLPGQAPASGGGGSSSSSKASASSGGGGCFITQVIP